MAITVKDLLDFIDKNQIPDDAVIIVPTSDNGSYYKTTVWCDAGDLSVDWDLNFHPDLDNKFFIGDAINFIPR